MGADRLFDEIRGETVDVADAGPSVGVVEFAVDDVDADPENALTVIEWKFTHRPAHLDVRAGRTPGDDGAPAWMSLKTAQSGTDAQTLDAEFAAKGVAGFEELVEACGAFDVKFMVCEMGLRARGWEDAPLRADIRIESGGVVSFLNDASKDGAMLFI